jgi:hypothetical protein
VILGQHDARSIHAQTVGGAARRHNSENHGSAP